MTSLFPDNAIELSHIENGLNVCGVDEVGRGSWAGPLVMSAVVPGEGTVEGVRDSKKISQKKRETLDVAIRQWAKAIGLGIVTNDEIDQWGMSRALNVCAQRAIEDIESQGYEVNHVLLDGHYDFIRQKRLSVETIVKGDNVSHVIAAASIIAKVYRDTYMASSEVAGKYSAFCFEKNKGYPSPVHKQALKDLGPTPLHRISWDIFGDSFSNNVQEVLI